MVGKDKAVKVGDLLVRDVISLASKLELSFKEQFKCGRRIWGAERKIDLILTHRSSAKRLGIECKAQDSKGSAEEKIAATIQDIDAWPISGLIVFRGDGFSKNFCSFMIASGKAVELSDLEPWLRLYFGLEI